MFCFNTGNVLDESVCLCVAASEAQTPAAVHISSISQNTWMDFASGSSKSCGYLHLFLSYFLFQPSEQSAPFRFDLFVVYPDIVIWYGPLHEKLANA